MQKNTEAFQHKYPQPPLCVIFMYVSADGFLAVVSRLRDSETTEWL